MIENEINCVLKFLKMALKMLLKCVGVVVLLFVLLVFCVMECYEAVWQTDLLKTALTGWWNFIWTFQSFILRFVGLYSS